MKKNATGRKRLSVWVGISILIGACAEPAENLIKPVYTPSFAGDDDLPTAGPDPVAQPGDSEPSSSLAWWGANFLFRFPISIQTQDDPIMEGYTVTATIDHQSLVEAGQSLASADDLRIVRDEDSVATELHRIVENPNQNDTRIRFQLAEPWDPQTIGSDRVAYFLYAGDLAANAPPQDPDRVFFYATEFDDPDDFAQDWTVHGVADVPVYQVQNDSLYNATNSNQVATIPFVNDKLVLTAKPPLLGARVSFAYRPGDTNPLLDDDLVSAGLCSDDADNAGFYVGVSGGDDWFTGEGVTPAGAPLPAAGFWRSDDETTDYVNIDFDLAVPHQVEISWTETSIGMTLDGIALGPWDAGPLTSNYFCLAVNSMLDFYIDHVRVELQVEQEPTLSLGPLETKP